LHEPQSRVAGEERFDPVPAQPHVLERRRTSECGTVTCSAERGKEGTSQRNSSVANAPPAPWATTKAGTSTGLMPANVFVKERARRRAARSYRRPPGPTSARLETHRRTRPRD